MERFSEKKEAFYDFTCLLRTTVLEYWNKAKARKQDSYLSSY